MHVIAAEAVAFGEAQQPEYKTYIEQVVKNANALAEGLMAEGVDIVSGGTDNHLLLIDLRSLNLTGKVAEHVLDAVGITTNKNTIPFDPESPFVTSGSRLGTPAVAQSGVKEAEMQESGEVMAPLLKNPGDEGVKKEAADRVAKLTAGFPLYE